MMKLYSMSLMAHKVTASGLKVEGRTGSVLAQNKDEALGKAVKYAKETFPSNDGWYAQSAVVAEVPQWQLDDLS
jgi:hypothetical protein